MRIATGIAEDEWALVIYDCMFFQETLLAVIARLYKSGNSQSVRLAEAFRFKVDRVAVTKDGDAVILRPYAEPKEAWSNLKEAMRQGLSDDFLANGREQP